MIFSLFLLSLKTRVGVLPPTLLSPLHLLPFVTHIFPSPTHVSTVCILYLFSSWLYNHIQVYNVCVYIYTQYPYTQLFWPFFALQKNTLHIFLHLIFLTQLFLEEMSPSL